MCDKQEERNLAEAGCLSPAPAINLLFIISRFMILEERGGSGRVNL